MSHLTRASADAKETARSADSLDRYANNSSPLSTRGVTARERRYGRRRIVSEVTRMKRVCACGRVIVGSDAHPGQVGVRRTEDGIVGLAGLATCGSVWVCPVCNAKIMSRRALEIGAAVTTWESRGGRVGFVTMTMRHNAEQSLSLLWDSLAYGWGKVTAGSQWIKDKDRFGIEGWVRVVEVTRTWANGWHVHVHALVFLAPGKGEDDLQQLHGRMFGRWSRALQRRGLDAPLMLGQDARLVDGAADERIAEYLTKSRDDATYRIGLEMVHSQSKIARSSFSSMTPWELLTLVDEATDEAEFLRALAAWHEWEEGSHGRRQIGWSKGLRDLLGLSVEKTDEEISEEVAGQESDTVVYITRTGWASLTRNPVLIGTMLDTLETLGADALRAFLDTHHIEYEDN